MNAYKFSGLGCAPDARCSCDLSGLGETKKLYYAAYDIVKLNKLPGDWFPLTTEMYPIAKGTLLGSVIEKKVVDGKNWYHFAVVGGWIMGEDGKFSTKTVTVVPLTDQQKMDIVTGVIKSTTPGAEAVIDTYEAGKKVLNVAKYVVPVLVVGVIVLGAAYVNNSFKDSPVFKKKKV